MPRWLVWPIFALLMGFALGGSFVWGVLYVAPEQYASQQQRAEGNPTQQEHKNGFWEKAADDPVAYFNLWLVGFTGVLAISTIGLWIVTWQSGKRRSKDMTDSIDVAERALIAGERAWIKVDIKIGGNLTIDETGINLRMIFRVTNCGTSPATNVRVFQNLLLKQPGHPEQLEIYRRFCANVRARGEKPPSADFRSYTLFPNEPKDIPVALYVYPEQIRETLEAWREVAKDYPDFFDLFMVGCAAYRIPFDDRQHQTGFSVEIKRRMSSASHDEGWGMFDFANEVVTANDITIIDSAWGSPSID